MLSNLTAQLADFDLEQRITFYEMLGHNLTIAVRAVWSDVDSALEVRLNRVKWINEILHQTTMKTRHLRSGSNRRSDEESVAELRHWASQQPSVLADIDWAIQASLEAARNCVDSR
jgi:hypothetical protein